MWGVDVQKEAVDICEGLAFPCNLKQIPSGPPVDLPADKFGLIYAFSVFSHLSPEAADAWVAEFHRILKPGGTAMLSTRPRSFIEMVGNARKMNPAPEWTKRIVHHFQDENKWLSRYNAGEFCFEPVGLGGDPSKSFYGEAVIPKDYVVKHWAGSKFRLCAFLAGDRLVEQNIIILQKK